MRNKSGCMHLFSKIIWRRYYCCYLVRYWWFTLCFRLMHNIVTSALRAELIEVCCKFLKSFCRGAGLVRCGKIHRFNFLGIQRGYFVCGYFLMKSILCSFIFLLSIAFNPYNTMQDGNRLNQCELFKYTDFLLTMLESERGPQGLVSIHQSTSTLFHVRLITMTQFFYFCFHLIVIWWYYKCKPHSF